MTRCSAPRRVRLAALAVLAFAGCSTELREAAPRPRAVAPSGGYRSADAEVAILGDGFEVEPYQAAGGTPAVDATFRAWLGGTALADVRWISSGELRARVPAGLPPGKHELVVRDPRGAAARLEDAFTVVDGAPASLSVTAAFTRPAASVGQRVTLEVEVANSGDVPARSVRPVLEVSGGAVAGLGAEPAARDVGPRSSELFALSWDAVEAGTALVSARASGTDPVTGAALHVAEPGQAALRVDLPAELSATATAARTRVSVGQTVLLDVVYENRAGVAGVVDLQPVVELVGPGLLGIVAEPGPCDVPAGERCTATFVFDADAPGTVEVRIDAAGLDANDRATPALAPRAPATIVVEDPPRLTGAVELERLAANVDQELAVTLVVSNHGEVAARGVEPRMVGTPVGALLVADPPAAQDVPAKGTARFGWRYAIGVAGEGAFTADATGWDANGAGTVTLPATVSERVRVVAAAQLAGSASASPGRVSAGQAVTVTFDVTNSGGAPARITPYLEADATGTAAFVAEPLAATTTTTIAGQGSATFGWTAVTSGSGTLTFWPRVAGVDLNDGTLVAAADPAPLVTVERPARLLADVEVPPTVTGERPFTAAVVVTNDGEAAAIDVSARLRGAGGASLLSGPTPAGPVTIAGGAVARFEWRYQAAAAPSAASFDADVAGTDANARTPLAAAAPAETVTVQRSAALSAEILSAPARVNLRPGAPRAFSVTVRVANSGETEALDVAALVGCAACTAGPEPAPATTLAALGAFERTRTFTPDALGTTTVTASAVGVDALLRDPMFAGTVERALAVEQPARLAVSSRSPDLAPVAGFTIEVEARNPRALAAYGQAAATAVRPIALDVVTEPDHLGPSQVACLPVPAAPATVPADGAARFAWSCASGASGRVKLAAVVAGEDANDGDPLLATTTIVLTLTEAAQVIADPFRDGTAFSFVFGYAGHVFLGPSGDGRGLVRCLPDGTGCASFTMKFWRDTTEDVVRGTGESATTSISENVLCPDLVTLGGAGCLPNNPEKTPCACGPDYEVGRGVAGAFRLGGDEWLVAMGRSKKAGDLNYAYMTRDTATPLELLYADLHVAMPPSAGIENVISMAELNGRLYFGVQSDAGPRPRLVVLTQTPWFPGLDAVPSEAFATTFQGTAMGESGGGTWPISQVDALAAFAGRIFVANKRAVLVSTSGYPEGDATADASTQFAACTPSPPDGTWEGTSIERYPTKRDVTPRDKGVTAMVAWKGKLYLARNTLANVPELWAFTPRVDGTGALLPCAAGDWRRVATNMGDPGNTHLTALFASGAYLYVGYDNDAGLQLWRTRDDATAPGALFTGYRGCAAGSVDQGGVPCAPVGGHGFGDPAANTRLLDARALTFGPSDHVWATVGNGASAVRVFRISE